MSNYYDRLGIILLRKRYIRIACPLGSIAAARPVKHVFWTNPPSGNGGALVIVMTANELRGDDRHRCHTLGAYSVSGGGEGEGGRDGRDVCRVWGVGPWLAVEGVCVL